MDVMRLLRQLNELAASQWGMVTAVQADMCGVSRMQVSRLVADGQLESLGHGVYRVAGAPAGRFDEIKAVWLSIDPKRTAEQRLLATPLDVVVSGATAAFVLELGDLLPEPYEFTVATRRQTRRPELVYRARSLASGSMTIRDGLPVTTPEQTIADLIDKRVDRSLVADVLMDAGMIDKTQLADLLAPLARRNGFTAGDGEAFCLELERLAGRSIDPAVIANVQAVVQQLVENVVGAIVPQLNETAMRILLPQMQQLHANIRPILESAREKKMAELGVVSSPNDAQTKQEEIQP